MLFYHSNGLCFSVFTSRCRYDIYEAAPVIVIFKMAVGVWPGGHCQRTTMLSDRQATSFREFAINM